MTPSGSCNFTLRTTYSSDAAFNVVKPATYAVQLFGKNDNSNDLFCFTNLFSHPAMIPSLLFTAQAFYDRSLGSTIGSIAHSHLARALRLLQSSLNDQNQATSHATMIVVASLATASLIMGDLETAAKHLDGLHKMVEMRGGLATLGPRSMVTYKGLS